MFWLWRQYIWPNLLRPWLNKRGLQASNEVCSGFAAYIEAQRKKGPVTPEIVKSGWDLFVKDPLIAQIGAWDGKL